MKKMTDKKIIRAFKPLLDMKKIGVFWHILLLKLKFVNDSDIVNIENFFKNKKEVFYIVNGVGNWHLMVEFHTRSYDEFNKIMESVRREIEDYIIGEATLQVLDEVKCTFFPFSE